MNIIIRVYNCTLYTVHITYSMKIIKSESLTGSFNGNVGACAFRVNDDTV